MNRIARAGLAVVTLATASTACGKSTRSSEDAEAKAEAPPAAKLPLVAPADLGIEQVDLDGYRGCARASNGGIYCWGQCRWDCAEAELRSTPEARLVRGITGVIDFTIGLGYGCAIDSVGAVWCWGISPSGSWGKLTEKEVLPGRIEGVAKARQLGTIAGKSTCALDDAGAVTCWGEGSRRVTTRDEGFAAAKPRVVTDAPKLASLERRHGLLCGVAREGGAWWCIGNAVSATDEWAWSARKVDAPPPAGTSGCGCSIDAAHRLRCEAQGLPGARMADGTSPPGQRLPCSIERLADVTAVATDGQRGCALSTTRSISCWGAGFFGGDASLLTLPPTKITGLPEVTTIGFAARRACALGVDKKLWCWRADRVPSLVTPKAAFAPDFEWDTQ